MVTKHNINFKKIFEVELLYHGFILCIIWLICDGYGSGSTKVKNYFENIYFCQEMIIFKLDKN